MFWFDAGAYSDCRPVAQENSKRRWGFHQMAYNSYFRNGGLRLGLENFATTDDNGVVLDEIAIRQVPYMALDSWVVNPPGDPTLPNFPEGRWHTWTVPNSPTIATQRSEMHILVSDSNLMNWDTMGNARARGYVLSVMDAAEEWKQQKVERVKRWYSMGIMHPADFNGDNSVDTFDSSDFGEAYLANRDDLNPSRLLTVFATGDINQDGHVTEADLAAFDTYLATVTTEEPLGVAVNYGAPNQP